MDSPSPIRIAAILPLGPEYAGRLLEGAISYTEEVRDVELVDLPYARDVTSPDLDTISDIDGALVWLRSEDRWVEDLIHRGVMVVNTSGDRTLEGLPLVAFTGSLAIGQAVQHIASLNRSHVAYIGIQTLSNPALVWRLKHFAEGVRHAGMRLSDFELGPAPGGIEDRSLLPSREQTRALDKFLRQLPLPASIWCQDDFVARLVCDRAATLGLKVPGDLAVLGFHDYRVARMRRPTISTIPQPGSIIGRKAIEWLHESIREGKRCEGFIAVPPPPVEVRESTSESTSGTRYLRQAHATIQEHACRGLTVDKLMQSIPLSQPNFSRQFAELYGTTPGAEIRQVKIEKARYFLSTTDFSIKRIASLCGFEQSGKFSTFFKRENGTTPSHFRKQSRQP